jgi:hypothetical protein
MRFNQFSTCVKYVFQRTGLALLAATAVGLAFGQTPFVISSVSNGLVLDDPASSTAPGIAVQQWTANGGKNQEWILKRSSNGLEVLSLVSGLAIGPQYGSDLPGVTIYQNTVTGAPSQSWQLIRGSDGYILVSAQLETIPCGGTDCLSQEAYLALDDPAFSPKAGERMQQWTLNYGTNQQWLFHPQSLAAFTIAMSVDKQTMTFSGMNFPAGAEVCPMIANFVYPTEGNCAVVESNGTFSSTTQFGGYLQLQSGGGYIAVTIESKSGNVLAIGSVAGSFITNIP